MNNNNNANEPQIYGNEISITYDQLPNNLEPYDDTEDSFFIGLSEFRMYGAGSMEMHNYPARKFARGPISIEPLEECPVCFENFDTTEANNGEASFPVGFAYCPLKFECGYCCCFGCFSHAYDDMTAEQERLGFRCFSCRQFHQDAIFLRIRTPKPQPPENDELIRSLVEEAEAANRKSELCLKKYHDCNRRIIDLMTENEELKGKLERLDKRFKAQKRKLERLEKGSNKPQKRKLFPSSEEETKKIKRSSSE